MTRDDQNKYEPDKEYKTLNSLNLIDSTPSWMTTIVGFMFGAIVSTGIIYFSTGSKADRERLEIRMERLELEVTKREQDFKTDVFTMLNDLKEQETYNTTQINEIKNKLEQIISKSPNISPMKKQN